LPVNSLATTIPVADSAMGMYASWPAGEGPFAAVVVIMHAGGVDTFTQAMATRLVEAGYFVAAPDLFHRIDARQGGMLDKLGQLRDPEVESDVRASLDWLQGHPRVAAERLAIMGFCMGGRVAYLMSALESRFRAAVAYYGGNIMQPWGDGPSPFSLSRHIHCPLLFHFGAEDSNPSPDDMTSLDRELNRLDKQHQFYSYPGAGHAFMNFANPERYRKQAADSSWPRTLAFLSARLT